MWYYHILLSVVKVNLKHFLFVMQNWCYDRLLIDTILSESLDSFPLLSIKIPQPHPWGTYLCSQFPWTALVSSLFMKVFGILFNSWHLGLSFESTVCVCVCVFNYCVCLQPFLFLTLIFVISHFHQMSVSYYLRLDLFLETMLEFLKFHRSLCAILETRISLKCPILIYSMQPYIWLHIFPKSNCI